MQKLGTACKFFFLCVKIACLFVHRIIIIMDIGGKNIHWEKVWMDNILWLLLLVLLLLLLKKQWKYENIIYCVCNFKILIYGLYHPFCSYCGHYLGLGVLYNAGVQDVEIQDLTMFCPFSTLISFTLNPLRLNALWVSTRDLLRVVLRLNISLNVSKKPKNNFGFTVTET